MPPDMRTHATTIEVLEPAPPEVAAGEAIVLGVKVSCPAGCDLGGMPVTVAAEGAADDGGALVTRADHDGTAAVKLDAPLRVGQHAWRVLLGPHECAGIRHDETSLPVRATVIPHATSLAVWAVPLPVVMGERFAINVGAKSSAGVALTGGSVAICDESGAVVAEGSLGDTPYPGTTALYWARIELVAPAMEGLRSWSIKFEPKELELPHDYASTAFSVSVVRPPEHRLTVKVIEKEGSAPVADAQVRLGAYRAATDPSGVAEIEMPKGVYDLRVWKVGYEAPATTVELSKNILVEIEVVPVPEENPDEAWLM
jgi:hypothetical protein